MNQRAANLFRRPLLLQLMVLVLAHGVFGQESRTVQLAANETLASPLRTPPEKVSVSPQELEARIASQQQEINDLRTLVEKLQATLEPVASTRPVIGGAFSLTAFPRTLFEASSAPPSLDPGPNPQPADTSFATPRELLPDIGHIGAEVGFLVGGSQNPYSANTGFFGGGFIDLPLKKVRGGKLSYEILISLQKSKTTVQSTSAVTALVNAIANVELGTAPSFNNLFGPFPVTTAVQERATVLTVAPVELKYTVTTLGRFRPYGVVGLGTYVGLSTQSNRKSFDATTVLGNTPLAATLNALLRGPQVAGLAPESPELRARGVPAGQGDLRFGAQFGGGLEFRVTPKLSWGVDYRRNKVEGSNAGFSSFSFNQAIHF